ncbi:MAG: ribonuclease J [Candidatus Parvarchaeota archaeon]|nr:ribonuclease J [Candidatus Rehaiarchaeum fermentans]
MSKIRLYTFGGYSEIGKSMSAIETENGIVIVDMGGNMDELIDYQTSHPNITVQDTNELISRNIIPNDSEFFKEKGKNVVAIVISHGHLDHAWATPFLAHKYKAPIICTPFTAEILKKLNKDFKGERLNLKIVPTGGLINIKGIQIKLVPITHSIPQASLVLIKSQNKNILYACDWKFDLHPLISSPVDFAELKRLGNLGIDVLISETTRIEEKGSTFSESVAENMIEDALIKSKDSKNIFFTTFSSHIARLRSVIKIGRKLGRKILVIGRSIDEYFSAAINSGVVERRELAEVIKEDRFVKKAMKRLKEGGFLVIGTGHQGEPGSFMSKLAINHYSYALSKYDTVIFSSQTIPTKVNIANRSMLQNAIMDSGAKIYDNVHVSGHGSREDHKKMLELIRPKIYIPAHGGIEKQVEGIKLAQELNYKLNSNTFLIGDNVNFDIE